jgi:hypothetical protein
MTVVLILIGLILLLGVLFVVMQLPEIRRYMKIRAM